MSEAKRAREPIPFERYAAIVRKVWSREAFDEAMEAHAQRVSEDYREVRTGRLMP